MTIEKQKCQTNPELLKLTKSIERLIIPRSKNMKAYKNIKKAMSRQAITHVAIR